MTRRRTKEERPVLTTLFCQACGKIMPADKAKKRSNTCSDACRNDLRNYRASILANGKCPYCYHPSSPEEWELFHRFRKFLLRQTGESSLDAFARPAHGLSVRAQAQRLRRAVVTALELVKIDADSLEFRSSMIGPDGAPDRATTAPEAAKTIGLMREQLAAWSELLEKTKELEPDSRAAELLDATIEKIADQAPGPDPQMEGMKLGGPMAGEVIAIEGGAINMKRTAPELEEEEETV